uniref:Uncharacterized protein n=1 Tax=Panagrolaimus superbus TaxID=310955 RepID=A0A914Y0M5_9BILA
MDKMLTDQNSAAIIGLIVICCIIYAIYRLFKFLQSKCAQQEPPISSYERVTEIVVQKRIKICKLPANFGPNAFLFTVTDNLDRGIKHVFVRHPRDFSTSKRSNENDVIKHLRRNLIAENFLGAEDDPRGNRYIWKSRGQNGVPKQLVTILSPRGKGYELITAYKR